MTQVSDAHDGDRDPEVREAAAQALVARGTAHAEAVPLAHRQSTTAQAEGSTAQGRQPRRPRPRRPPQKSGRGEGTFVKLLRRGLPVFRT